jgi:hypothetical protein
LPGWEGTNCEKNIGQFLSEKFKVTHKIKYETNLCI